MSMGLISIYPTTFSHEHPLKNHPFSHHMPSFCDIFLNNSRPCQCLKPIRFVRNSLNFDRMGGEICRDLYIFIPSTSQPQSPWSRQRLPCSRRWPSCQWPTRWTRTLDTSIHQLVVGIITFFQYFYFSQQIFQFLFQYLYLSQTQNNFAIM